MKEPEKSEKKLVVVNRKMIYSNIHKKKISEFKDVCVVRRATNCPECDGFMRLSNGKLSCEHDDCDRVIDKVFVKEEKMSDGVSGQYS